MTKEDSDNYKFKVPSLRNIALTAPYFHNGSVPTLKEAVIKMGFHQLDKKFTHEEATTVVDFLKTLTDKPRVVTD